MSFSRVQNIKFKWGKEEAHIGELSFNPYFYTFRRKVPVQLQNFTSVEMILSGSDIFFLERALHSKLSSKGLQVRENRFVHFL